MAFHLLTQDRPINAKAKQAWSNVNMCSSIKLKYVTAVIICAYFNLSCAAERVGASAKNTLNVL